MAKRRAAARAAAAPAKKQRPEPAGGTGGASANHDDDDHEEDHEEDHDNEDHDKRPYEDAAYWEKRYARDSAENETDEWGFSYEDLEPLLDPLRPKGADPPPLVVDLGCGVSEMLLDMATQGWKDVKLLGVDLAASAVRAMQDKTAARGLEDRVAFEQVDLTKLDARFGEESVDLYIDKMTMDAILHADDGEHVVRSILRQIARTLRPQGSFLLVSQMHPEDDVSFLELVVAAFEEGCSAKAIWRIDVHIASDESVGLNVYTFTKRPRHGMARRSGRESRTAIIKVHHH